MRGIYETGDEIYILNNSNKEYHRGDCVVLELLGKKILKQIYGIPYDYFHVHPNGLTINDCITNIEYSEILLQFEKQWNSILPQNNYIVFGTTKDSYDSRVFGPVLNTCILGKAIKNTEK